MVGVKNILLERTCTEKLILRMGAFTLNVYFETQFYDEEPPPPGRTTIFIYFGMSDRISVM